MEDYRRRILEEGELPVSPLDMLNVSLDCPHYIAGHNAGFTGEYGQPPHALRGGDRGSWHKGWDAGRQERCNDIGVEKAHKLAAENSRKIAAKMFNR